MAISYLTIAAGTGHCNRLSFWSAHAIEKYTGLHSIRASEAIKSLIADDHVRLGEKSVRTRPRYQLQPYEGGGTVPAEDLIWLPNTVVTGTVRGEASPAKRLRSRGDLDALRLFIDLYQVQHLSAEGGISRKVLYQEYEREKYGERGGHVVWGFTAGRLWANPHPSTEFFWEPQAEEKGDCSPIWDALETMIAEGLLEIVPHLVETPELDCELIHGFGWNGVGEPIEQELAKLADAAGRYIIGDLRIGIAERAGVQLFAPAWGTRPDVQMVGVYRLTYRPQTELTADWYRRMNEAAADWMTVYAQIGPPKRALNLALGL
jgi:hypothetical protein